MDVIAAAQGFLETNTAKERFLFFILLSRPLNTAGIAVFIASLLICDAMIVRHVDPIFPFRELTDCSVGIPFVARLESLVPHHHLPDTDLDGNGRYEIRGLCQHLLTILLPASGIGVTYQISITPLGETPFEKNLGQWIVSDSVFNLLSVHPYSLI
jgi:hypothetical protein